MFEQPEWDNFVRVTRTRPLRMPTYALDIVRLVCRRSLNVARLRTIGKGHRGFKQWPKWLGAKAMTITAPLQDNLHLPTYPRLDATVWDTQCPQIHFEQGDCEAYFAIHRWGYCVEASLSGPSASRAALQKVLAWIDEQPERYDAAWEPYSVCERLVNLAVMLSVDQVIWQELAQINKQKIARYFTESVQWIHDHLEYYGQKRTNNHILNNARALAVAGSMIGDRALLDRGLLLFSTMARQLVLPDGSLRERSSHYQCIITNWLLDILQFASSQFPDLASESDCFKELQQLSQRMTAVTAILLETAFKSQSHIGDISPDSHPSLTEKRLHALYGEKLPRLSTQSAQKDDWIFTAIGQSRLLACATPSRHPVEYKTHGHGDLGSFIWSYGPQPILVDRGRVNYAKDPLALRQCRAAGHNVLMVNGLPALSDSVLTAGEWLPIPYVSADINTRVLANGSFTVQHNGFARIPRVGSHQRTVTVYNNYIEIRDQLDGDCSIGLEMFWHFSPDLAPVSGSENTIAGNGCQVQVHTDTSNSTFDWGLFPHSSAYGDIKEGHTLRIACRADLPWSCITRMEALSCAE